MSGELIEMTSLSIRSLFAIGLTAAIASAAGAPAGTARKYFPPDAPDTPA